MVDLKPTPPYFFCIMILSPRRLRFCTRDEGMKDPIRSSSILLVVECGFQPFRGNERMHILAFLNDSILNSIANLKGSVKAIAQGSYSFV